MNYSFAYHWIGATLIIIKKIAMKHIDKKLNELIVDMMIEENNHSDYFKLYIKGTYQFVDVKIEAMDQYSSEKSSLILTNSDPYISDSKTNDVGRITTPKYDNYFSVNSNENSKIKSDKRIINEEDKENIVMNNYEC